MMAAMPGLPSNPRAGLFRALLRARIAVLCGVLVGGALGGCFATEPQLYPFDPPPNIPPDLLLLEVPDEAVSSMHSAHVDDELGTVLLGNALKVGYEPISDERRAQILAHQVVTGMTLREVKWALVADPARIRDQGPPGGTTLIWETPGGIYGRFWVRFDDYGKAADAGSY
jgi:hypothetical protein